MQKYFCLIESAFINLKYKVDEATREAVNQHIERLAQEGMTFLEQLVNVDSHSRDKTGVNNAGEIITDFLAKH